MIHFRLSTYATKWPVSGVGLPTMESSHLKTTVGKLISNSNQTQMFEFLIKVLIGLWKKEIGFRILWNPIV